MGFSHLDEQNLPKMVNVGDKNVSRRRATAKAEMFLGEEIMSLLTERELNTKKGPVFHTAILAGIQAVKNASNLIPLCHPLPIQGIDIDIREMENDRINIICTVDTQGKTGVEMEALTGVSVAALTVYDMCKAISQDMIIEDIRLVEKTGGKSDIKKEQ